MTVNYHKTVKLLQTHHYGVILAQNILVFIHMGLQSFPFSLTGYLKWQICNSLETNLAIYICTLGEWG